MELLLKICKEDGVTVFSSLHQVDLAIKFADRIIGINEGKVVFDDTTVNLIHGGMLETIYSKKDNETIAV